ncbi:MAG: iron ABC transporter permease [Erysipelotrichaceae bacterium]|nr:iron ABC transporter permease [Erysipelotrichaceae bacterium]
MKKRNTIILLSILLVIVTIMGLCFGSVSLSFNDLIKAFTDYKSISHTIVFKLRLPRVLGAILSGLALGLSGLILQTITDNELCSPNIIGVNSGAGLMVMLVLCFAGGSFYLLPLASFIGAFFTTVLVIAISRSSIAHSSKTSIVLTGVAVSSLFSAFISMLSQLYPDVLPSYVYFQTGGFNGVYLKDIALPAIIIIGGAILVYLLNNQLEIMLLKDDLASSLGVNVKKLRVVTLLLASALTASSVTYAGLLGFVGLLVPHMARKIAGARMSNLIIITALLGSILTVTADLIGRMVFAPSELSAGVILAFIGAPFFIYLLFNKRNSL